MANPGPEHFLVLMRLKNLPLDSDRFTLYSNMGLIKESDLGELFDCGIGHLSNRSVSSDRSSTSRESSPQPRWICVLRNSQVKSLGAHSRDLVAATYLANIFLVGPYEGERVACEDKVSSNLPQFMIPGLRRDQVGLFNPHSWFREC